MNARRMMQVVPAMLVLCLGAALSLITSVTKAAAAEHPAVSKPQAGEQAKAPGKSPAKAAKRKPRSKSSKLDLTVRAVPAEKRSGPDDPRHASTARPPNAPELDARAAEAETSYQTEPLFQSEQKLQILDAEVPVTVKLGRWKTNDANKALGLSATVPLMAPAK